MIMVVSMIFPFELQAQRSVEVGILGGTAFYNGDITPARPYVLPRPAYGVLARYNLDDRWTVKASFINGEVEGSDYVSKAVANRGLAFSTNISEIAFTGEFNFWEYETGSKAHALSPYLMGGGSLFFYSPKSPDGTDLRSMGTEGQNVGYQGRSPYGKSSFAIIFGVGFKYSLTKRLGLAVEWGMRKTFTDYLDDVSTTYYESYPYPGGYSDPTGTHIAGEQRGNSATKDWYNFTVASLTYKINLTHGMSCRSLNW